MNNNIILPQPGNDWRSWAQSLVVTLQQMLNGRTTGTQYIVDTQGRPVVTPDGLYAYSGSGAQVVVPNLVSINTEDLVNAAITTEKLANAAVDNTKLASLAVQAANLANNSVTATKIANAAVGNAAIANAAVGTAEIANAAITSALIADLAVVNAKIADATIQDAKIASLSASKIIAGVIGVGSIYLGDDSVELDGANKRIVVQDITTNPYTPFAYFGYLSDGSIGIEVFDSSGNTVFKASSSGLTFSASAFIGNASITNAMIANAAIGTAQIQNGAITNALIGSAAIGTANIQSGAITNALIGNAAIQSANIASAAVGTLAIAGQAVTFPQWAYTAGTLNVSATTWTTVQTLTISVPNYGQSTTPVEIIGSARFNGSAINKNTGTFECRLIVGGAVQGGTQGVPYLASYSYDSTLQANVNTIYWDALANSVVALNLAPGNHTVQFQVYGSYSGNSSNRYIRGLVLKR